MGEAGGDAKNVVRLQSKITQYNPINNCTLDHLRLEFNICHSRRNQCSEKCAKETVLLRLLKRRGMWIKPMTCLLICFNCTAMQVEAGAHYINSVSAYPPDLSSQGVVRGRRGGLGGTPRSPPTAGHTAHRLRLTQAPTTLLGGAHNNNRDISNGCCRKRAE